MSNPEEKKPQADTPLNEEELDTVTGGKRVTFYDSETGNRFCRDCSAFYPPEQFVNNCCPKGHPQ